MIENTDHNNFRSLQGDTQVQKTFQGHEYRSQTELFGLPIVHIARGIDPNTGRLRVAKGIIAIGDIAIGLLALGGVAVGGVAIGGVSLGIIAAGGIALSLLIALGGVSLGLYMALGAVAISIQYAIGALAIGLHPFGDYTLTPEFLHQIEQFLPNLSGWFQNIRR
jgi:hypothetical protein